MRIADIHPDLHFSRVIYFKTPDRSNALQGGASNSPVENKPEPVPEEILSVFKKAKRINAEAYPILDASKDVYAYASRMMHKTNLKSYKIASLNKNRTVTGILREIDDFDNTLISEAKFDRDGNLLLINDYKNKRIIRIDEKTNLMPIKTFTVFVGCSDMENRNIIKAEHSYSFVSGELKRYTPSCEADINSDRLIADKAFSFKRNVLKSFDYHYALSCGAEYSNEYYAFELHPRYDASVAYLKNRPVRYVENKIAIKDIIYSSTKDISLSRYEFPEE